MKFWRLAMADREGPVHRAVLNYLRLVMPGALIHHSPNENSLSNRDRTGAAISSARARSLGTVKGFPDILVLPDTSRIPMFFEVKSGSGKLTEAQELVVQQLRALGYFVGVVRSVDEVAALLKAWEIPRLVKVSQVEYRGFIS